MNNKGNLLNFFVFLTTLVIVLFSLVAINGNKSPFRNSPQLAKYFSSTYIDRPEDVLTHEAFVVNHLGYEKNKIVLTGSCQLEALWCTKDVLKTECSIAHLLEQNLLRKSIPVRVMNLSIGIQATGHNLNVFLRFLEDSRYKVFVWHNEFPSTLQGNSIFGLPKKELASFLPYIYKKTNKLIEYHPEIEELYTLSSRIKNVFPNINKMENQYFPENKMNLMNSFIHNIKFLFKDSLMLNEEEVIQRVRRNTSYLRFLIKRIASIKAQISPQIVYSKFEKELNSLPVKQYDKIFYNSNDGSVSHKSSIIHYDNILSLKLMDKLAGLYNKKIYVYIGPEAQCQENEYFTNNYYNPISHVVSKLKHTELLDLSNFGIIPQKESFNCVNMTYLGNKKIAEKMSEIFKNNDRNILYEKINL